MVNEFSEYARSPAPNFASLDLNVLIRDVMSLYDMPGIKMELLLKDTPCHVKGDSTMLRQVLHNLLQNAQDALLNHPEPVIQVKTTVEQDCMLLTVKDNGGGFPAEMMPHVFEPYMTTKAHGTGLGLAIVKKIVEEHKGQIKIENIDQGALVTISIPIYKEG
jgi:nitrogen fixation/metabolism regulation signal transduction histidine kinase